MKKLLENLNKAELEKVFETNSKLRDDVFNDMCDSYYVDENYTLYQHVEYEKCYK